MATSKDFEKLWKRYQDEVQSSGKSIVTYCQENGIVYAQFERWYKKRGSSQDRQPVQVPVEVTWAHVRAKFHLAKEVSKDDYASWFEDMISKLYLIESQLIIAHATPEEIRARRQQKDVHDLPYHHRDLQAGQYYGQGLSDLCSLRTEPWK